MENSKFEKAQINYLAKLLSCEPQAIKSVLSNIDKYYYTSTRVKLDKVTGLPKTYSDGTEKIRTLTPSINLLKILQSRIKQNILAKVSLPKYIQGGVKGRSNVSNSKEHKGKKYRLCLDLQDFFPSITNATINKMYLGLGYSSLMANWLTKLTSFNYALPQGSPTSSLIANLVFDKDVDFILLDICKQNDITYTRFVDDLTFSSQKDFQEIIPKILNCITNAGYKINYRKTKYSYGQQITGVEVYNNFIDAPKKIIDKALAEDPADPSKPYTYYRRTILKTNTGVTGINAEHLNPVTIKSVEKIQISKTEATNTNEPPPFVID